MKSVLFFGPFLALTACNTVKWNQSGKTDRDLLKDKGECRVQAKQACGELCAGVVSNSIEDRYFFQCMEGRGWDKEVEPVHLF